VEDVHAEGGEARVLLGEHVGTAPGDGVVDGVPLGDPRAGAGDALADVGEHLGAELTRVGKALARPLIKGFLDEEMAAHANAAGLQPGEALVKLGAALLGAGEAPRLEIVLKHHAAEGGLDDLAVAVVVGPVLG